MNEYLVTIYWTQRPLTRHYIQAEKESLLWGGEGGDAVVPSGFLDHTKLVLRITIKRVSGVCDGWGSGEIPDTRLLNDSVSRVYGCWIGTSGIGRSPLLLESRPIRRRERKTSEEHRWLDRISGFLSWARGQRTPLWGEEAGM